MGTVAENAETSPIACRECGSPLPPLKSGAPLPPHTIAMVDGAWRSLRVAYDLTVAELEAARRELTRLRVGPNLSMSEVQAWDELAKMRRERDELRAELADSREKSYAAIGAAPTMEAASRLAALRLRVESLEHENDAQAHVNKTLRAANETLSANLANAREDEWVRTLSVPLASAVPGHPVAYAGLPVVLRGLFALYQLRERGQGTPGSFLDWISDELDAKSSYCAPRSEGDA